MRECISTAVEEKQSSSRSSGQRSGPNAEGVATLHAPLAWADSLRHADRDYERRRASVQSFSSTQELVFDHVGDNGPPCAGLVLVGREFRESAPACVSPEGARAYVIHRWGEALVASYGPVFVAALDEARSLRLWQRRGAKLTRREGAFVQPLNRKHGEEIVYHRAIFETARCRPELWAVVTSRTAYLLAVSDGAAACPQNRGNDRGCGDLHRADARWLSRWRKWTEELACSDRVSQAEERSARAA